LRRLVLDRGAVGDPFVIIDVVRVEAFLEVSMRAFVFDLGARRHVVA
jgi:hypothetical protein